MIDCIVQLFKRRKDETIAVDLEGLGQLINDIDGTWTSDIRFGPVIRIRPSWSTPGVFLVTIGPESVSYTHLTLPTKA